MEKEKRLSESRNCITIIVQAKVVVKGSRLCYANGTDLQPMHKLYRMLKRYPTVHKLSGGGRTQKPVTTIP